MCCHSHINMPINAPLRYYYGALTASFFDLHLIIRNFTQFSMISGRQCNDGDDLLSPFAALHDTSRYVNNMIAGKDHIVPSLISG